MAYTTQTDTKTTLRWVNPHGGESYAVIVDDEIVELFVPSTGGQSVVYTTNQTDLSHLNEVVTELLAFLNPAP